MQLQEESIKIVEEELNDLKKRIADNIISSGQNASGRTIASLRVEMQEDGGVLYGRNYFGSLETGRKPGPVPYHFSDIILQWMKDKGIVVEKPKSFAFLVARKIANEGTALYRSGGRDDVYSKEIEKTVDSVMKRVSAIMATDVEHINLNRK